MSTPNSPTTRPTPSSDADSIARRGRAVAVNLIAATQRPTQKAMGQGAVRSQMDVRICFRVRERKDVDLILGQGMLTAGWHAHTLNAPGKFLISAAEHDTPRRARAYLLTDQAVADTASRVRRPSARRSTRSPSKRSRSRPSARTTAGPDPTPPTMPTVPEDAKTTTEAMLWAALSLAPDDGITVPDLMTATGMSRPWIYLRLRDLAEQAT